MILAARAEVQGIPIYKKGPFYIGGETSFCRYAENFRFARQAEDRPMLFPTSHADNPDGLWLIQQRVVHATERLSMRKIRDVLRLRFENGLSERAHDPLAALAEPIARGNRLEAHRRACAAREGGRQKDAGSGVRTDEPAVSSAIPAGIRASVPSGWTTTR